MRIGLFGGTFDPPHPAHLAASLLALKRLKLDRVWWLVTPGNPLKNTSGLAPLEANRRRPRAHHPSAHRRHRARSRHQHIHLQHDKVAKPAARASSSSGSWVRTTSAASTAGRNGADSRIWCRSWSSTASGPAFTPPPVRPARRFARARTAEPEAASLPFEAAGLGFLHGLKSPLSSTAMRALRRAGELGRGESRRARVESIERIIFAQASLLVRRSER